MPLPAPAALPDPARHSVGALPPRVEPPDYRFSLQPGGGFQLTVAGVTYRVESTYSYPHGGFNRLAAGPGDTSSRSEWTVSTGRSTGKRFELTARGRHYSIQRTIHLEPSRVRVLDKITNLTDGVIGIILSNRVNTAGMDDVSVTRMSNPTVFVAAGKTGLGLIALDDL